MKKRVVIIGGGITGLTTAFFLQDQVKGADVTLIEADQRWGGKLTTEQVGDFIIEGGPDSLLTSKPHGLALCRALGLEGQIVQTHPVHKTTSLLYQGRLQLFPEGMNLMIPGRITPFLTTPLISWYGKARMGLDLMIPRKNPVEDESIAAFVRRRFGEEAVSLFAEPILATIYAGDAEQLSMAATFPHLISLEREFGSLIWGMGMKKWDARLAAAQREQKGNAPKTLFVTLKNGLSSLVTALLTRLDNMDRRLGQPVVELAPHPSGGYAVVLKDETLRADAVVLATDAMTAARLIQPWDRYLAGHLDIPYVSTATVSLGFRRDDVTHPLNGFGFVIARSERKHILAVTWSSTKFQNRADPSHVLIRSFMGGVHHEEDVDLSDDQLAAIAGCELGPLLGIRAKPIVARVFKWRKGNPQYNCGHLCRVADIGKGAEQHAGLFITGAAYKGVGIPDCIAQGEETAQKVARFIQAPVD